MMTTIPLTASVGLFPHDEDVGKTLPGFTKYDASTQVYSMTGGGYNIWFDNDAFHYTYDELEGDFILTAEFAFVGEGKNAHRKVGWMVRSSLDPRSAHATATLHGDGLTVLQWREAKGAEMHHLNSQHFAPKSHYQILQLERRGKVLIFRAAHPGEPLQFIGQQELPALSGKVLAGLFLCSHEEDTLESAQAWNVRIDFPLPEDYNAYESGLVGSRLETIDIETRLRNTVYTTDEGIEAPNWLPDGSGFIVNKAGLLYRIPPNGDGLLPIDTGFANQLNNDHVLSWKADRIGISHWQDGGSRIFIVPVEGGTPEEVTPLVPSYLHGWSPDDGEMVYTASRNDGPYNVFKIRLSDKKETQLTFVEGLADGPEYSPDGKYIYYNSTESGTMQIWRMQVDGFQQEQLTFDERNNWFPHISPDNQWIVYISFPESVSPTDHPHYKRVELRLMPVAGGAPRTIAYLYGGQGSINVPSWSPDSRRVAFVSYFGKRKASANPESN